MVYRKKGYKRKSRKRTYRKRWTKRSRYNRKGQQVYLFKRHCAPFGVLTIDNISNTLTGYNFSLGDIPNPTEFTNLYDCYKINAVKITFLPQMTVSNSLGSVNNPDASARFFSAIDYNDSGAVSTIDQIREYQSVKCTPILRKHSRYFKPKIMDAGSVYNPGSRWLTCGSTAPNYFGIKIAVEPMGSSTTLSMDYSIECIYYMSFKNVK